MSTIGSVSEIQEIRSIFLKQVAYGLGWWTASSIALAFALGSPNASTLWFGGLLVAPFHWYRAIKIWSDTKKVGLNLISRNGVFLLIATACIVSVSAFTIGTEWNKISSESMGTCWAETDTGVLPVACWSPQAKFKTIGFASSENSCPSNYTWTFPPNSKHPGFYTCLVET